MTSHLGASVSALVDGELDHPHRERVLAHLAHCLPCRAEVEAQRRFKQSLRVLAGPPPGLSLSDRLLAISDPAPMAEASWSWPPAATPHGPARPVRRASRRRSVRLRRGTVGGALVALGLGGALALGGPPPRGTVAPVDPTSASFIVDYASTTPEIPVAQADTLSASFRSTP